MSAALSLRVTWPFVTVTEVTLSTVAMHTSEVNVPSTVTALNAVLVTVVEYIRKVLYLAANLQCYCCCTDWLGR